eukprot:CAMPEP_0170503004 /NCGR_PEP_ID=MMETSP0208-20121228/43318_1 /TAXON_ID=197538 /ORGANISM="Strombidium inclinatum, Strain S3" /LENGTH=98 /DNA_ID=CAMNT_0010782413 /DNA_START=141 /DNA_END=437 /DNA_ORIENTATION=-
MRRIEDALSEDNWLHMIVSEEGYIGEVYLGQKVHELFRTEVITKDNLPHSASCKVSLLKGNHVDRFVARLAVANGLEAPGVGDEEAVIALQRARLLSY